MRLSRLVAALAVLLTSSPTHAGPPKFRCQARGGTAWRELRTEHFLVETDLPSGKARELARELEMMLSAVRHGLFRAPPPMPGTIRVVALRSGEDFDLFAPERADAFYARSRWGEPVIVLPGVFGEVQRIVIAHELTHHVLARGFARQPLWFSEGTATFMETVGSSGPGSTPTMGGVPQWRYRSVFPYHGGIGAVLVAKGRLELKQYGLAWALVHFLRNRHPQELGELMLGFARGQDPTIAWREVFPQWDPTTTGGAERLDDAIGRYLKSGRFGYRDVKLPPVTEAVERAMSASEAHAVRLSLPWLNRGKPFRLADRLPEADEALAEDPANVDALAIVARARPEEALAAARRAVQLRPGDARAWMHLSERLPKDDAVGREEALRRAVQVAPESAMALNNLAWELLGSGRSGEALPLARKAALLAPWDAATLDTLAGVHADLGQCDEALTTQRRAIDVLPEAASAENRLELTERLAQFERQCRIVPAAAAP
jgi:tetratricopeptide (TPR) repeat protein